jgi:SAM-dependent methyltransferase
MYCHLGYYSYYPSYPNTNEDYDLITFFDILHHIGNPIGAVSHALRSLKSDGTVVIVEPFANDRIEENFNPLGRMFYAGSTMVCVPDTVANHGPALGAQAGEAKICEIVRALDNLDALCKHHLISYMKQGCRSRNSSAMLA